MFFAFLDNVSFIDKLSLFSQFDLKQFLIIYTFIRFFTY